MGLKLIVKNQDLIISVTISGRSFTKQGQCLVIFEVLYQG